MANSTSTRSGETIVVTGGAGFLGQHIVKHLLQQTEFTVREIRVFDVKPLSWHTGLEHVEVGTIGDIPTTQCIGNLCNMDDVQNAFAGATVVIHNASIVDVTSMPDTELLYQVNVIGTRNVVRACIDNNINTLIYTSSASADIKLGYYGDCKNQAERLILQADQHVLNNGNRISTCALRLPGMYGEGSTDVLGSIRRNIVNNTFCRSGDETSKYQSAYAGNVAWAFVAAIRKLQLTSPDLAGNPAGRAIGITDDTPLTTYCGHLEPFLNYFHLESSRFIMPFWFLYILAFICEWLSFILKPVYLLKLPLSTVAVDHMRCLPVYDSDDAKVYLDYKPIYTFEESVKKTMVYLEHELGRYIR